MDVNVLYFKDTYTGDTITSSSSVATSVVGKLAKSFENPGCQKAVLSGVHVPEPVFFCSIEPASVVPYALLMQHLIWCKPSYYYKILTVSYLTGGKCELVYLGYRVYRKHWMQH